MAPPIPPIKINSVLNLKNISIEFEIEAESWKSIFGLQSLVEEVSLEVFQNCKNIVVLSEVAEIEVFFLFTDDQKSRHLNKSFRGLDKPTNVLSFPSETKDSIVERLNDRQNRRDIILGDVVLSYGVVMEEAEMQQKDINHHVSHLIVHGLLHLLGFDHILDSEADEMEQMEISILSGLGISNPYGREALCAEFKLQ